MFKGKSVKKSIFYHIGLGALILILFSCYYITSKAETKQYKPKSSLYENTTALSTNSEDSVNSFSYGKQIGVFNIKGSISNETKISNVTAYAVDGTVDFSYDCSPKSYQTKTKEQWNLEDCNVKTIGDLSLSKKIGKGVLVIQKSSDGKTWEDACKPFYDFLSRKKIDYSALYQANEEDINKGTYYKTIVAYEMKRKVDTKKNWLGVSTDVYEYKYFVESYSFYLCYSKNPIKVYDLRTRKTLSNNATVADGFTIDNCNANVTINVKKDNGAEKDSAPFQAFTAPGTYTIKATSPLGDSFQTNIKITKGMSVQKISTSHYENQAKKGYSLDNAPTDGILLSSLMIGQQAGKTIKSSVHNGVDSYGITGERAELYINLKSPEELAKAGWEVVPDDFGKKEKQTIEGVWVGTVSSGALIVQKSTDGKTWESIDSKMYSNGLYTTDFYTYYGGKGDINIYSPNGKEILNGIYIRVIYAYEIKQKDGNEKKRCIEEKTLFLCNDELGAVTFHNLTVKDQIKEMIGGENEIELDMYKTAETMDSGAVTVSGFKIDTTLNPTVEYTVKKNGKPVNTKNKTEFTESGRYEIELKSAVGSTDTVELYVDRMTNEQTLERYFGNGFIDGKRIFTEGDYPTYEAGFIKYAIKEVSDEYQPLYGEIVNMNSGQITEISADRNGFTGEIKEPGEYVVTLHNNPTFKTDSPSGDDKEIKFHFNVIANGSAPGPVVNQKSLDDFVKNSVSGIYPKYYGLVYQSAATGYIIKAFSTFEAAREYAYKNESGMVEVQQDGTYLYTNSSIIVPKARYDSVQDLTDERNKAADEAVYEMYIDVSDKSTYITLKNDVLEKNDNLKTLELSRSIFVFDKNEEAKLRNINALPILNSVSNVYLVPGRDGKIVEENAAFCFVKDKYGYDSDKVTITDINGKNYNIEYQKPVDVQLEEQGCPTSIVTITETTVYGDSTSYQAIYFSNEENTAKLSIKAAQDKTEKLINITQENEGNTVYADYFSIDGIEDKLDPYSLVIVKEPNGNSRSFVADDNKKIVWSDSGQYEVSVVNRIGNKYSFFVMVQNNDFATISFRGEGTEEFQPVIVNKNDKNVILPTPDRLGYDFFGYIDDEGTIYENNIEQISFSGTKVFSPIWKPKQIKITLQKADGSVIEELSEEYGAEITLPVPELEKNSTFNGWMDEQGNLIPEGIIQISDEDDITLVAVISQKDGDDSKVQNDKNNKHLLPIGLGAAFLVLAGGGGGIYFANKKKRFSIKNNDETPETK